MKAEDHAIGMGDADVLLDVEAPMLLCRRKFGAGSGTLQKQAGAVRFEQGGGKREQMRQ